MSAPYPLMPIEFVIEVLVFLALVGILFVILWFKLFAYSPNRVYRMNRFTGFIMKSKTIFAEPSWQGGFIIWDGVGFARDKAYVLSMWGQRLEIDVESNVLAKEEDGKSGVN